MNPLLATRANHALEHATITLILRDRDFQMRIAGRSTPTGFWVYGDVPTDELAARAHEALERLQRGEAHLAISPFCGTNLAIAGLLTASVAAITLRRGLTLERFTNALLGTTLAALASQPLGRFVQRHLTTSADLDGFRIDRVERVPAPVPAHRVVTTVASR